MRNKATLFALAASLIIGVLPLYAPNASSGATQSVSPSPTLAPSPTPTPKPIRLLCLNNSKKTLRISDVKSGCLRGESSLGATAIKAPAKRPSALNPFLYRRFLAAQAVAKKARRSLVITSGFRSYAVQAALFKAAVKKYGSEAEAAKSVLPPGSSHHPWGLALDINYPNDPLSAKWLEINGYKYGLCRVYKNEWWHFEGVTAPGHRCPAMHPDATWDLE